MNVFRKALVSSLALITLSTSLPAFADGAAGAIGGAVLGGVLGSRFGAGSGRAASVAGGALLGGILGHKLFDRSDEDGYRRTRRDSLDRFDQRKFCTSSGDTIYVKPKNRGYHVQTGARCVEYFATKVIDRGTYSNRYYACSDGAGNWYEVSQSEFTYDMPNQQPQQTYPPVWQPVPQPPVYIPEPSIPQVRFMSQNDVNTIAGRLTRRPNDVQRVADLRFYADYYNNNAQRMTYGQAAQLLRTFWADEARLDGLNELTLIIRSVAFDSSTIENIASLFHHPYYADQAREMLYNIQN